MTDRKPQPSAWPPDVRDLAAAAGLTLLGVGFWLIYPPAAFIVPGALMVAIAVFGVRG